MIFLCLPAALRDYSVQWAAAPRTDDVGPEDPPEEHAGDADHVLRKALRRDIAVPRKCPHTTLPFQCLTFSNSKFPQFDLKFQIGLTQS